MRALLFAALVACIPAAFAQTECGIHLLPGAVRYEVFNQTLLEGGCTKQLKNGLTIGASIVRPPPGIPALTSPTERWRETLDGRRAITSGFGVDVSMYRLTTPGLGDRFVRLKLESDSGSTLILFRRSEVFVGVQSPW